MSFIIISVFESNENLFLGTSLDSGLGDLTSLVGLL